MVDFRELRPIEGYGDKYLVGEDGVIFRNDEDTLTRVAQFGDPPRVTLYRNGKRYQPYVKTLVRRLFTETSRPLPG